MCNLYSMTKGQQAIRALSRAMRDTTGNLPLFPGVFPDYPAPIVRTAADGVRELALVRWGMPSSKKALFDATSKRADKLRAKGGEIDFDQLLRIEPDKGTTYVRNTASAHWKPHLAPESRCVVPFTSFSEPDQVGGSLQPSGSRSTRRDRSPSSPASGSAITPACARSRRARSRATCSLS